MNAEPTFANDRVLVTGASGFIGHHCLGPLVAKGFEVHAVQRGSARPSQAEVTWHSADLLDPVSCRALIDRIRPTAMLHLAWYVEPGKLISHVDNLRWLASSIDLVRAFRDAGGERCVVAGTCYEYDWRYGYCSEELTGTNAGTLYGASKNALRQVLEAYGAVDGLALAWGRVFFLYGPREHPRRLVSSVIAALLQGRTAPTSHGRQVRDYLYVQDVADGLVALLVSKEVGCFNICSGNALTLRDIVEKIGTLIGRPDLLQIGAVAARANDAPLVVGDGVRTARAVGWTPRFNLETGLLLTIDWWREQLKLPVQGAR